MYYDVRKERFCDPEWEEAEKANEPEQYFCMYMYNGGKCIKRYKPSVAELVRKRTGMKLEIVN